MQPGVPNGWVNINAPLSELLLWPGAQQWKQRALITVILQVFFLAFCTIKANFFKVAIWWHSATPATSQSSCSLEKEPEMNVKIDRGANPQCLVVTDQRRSIVYCVIEMCTQQYIFHRISLNPGRR